MYIWEYNLYFGLSPQSPQRARREKNWFFGLRAIVGVKQRGTILKMTKNVHRGGEVSSFRLFGAISGGAEEKLFRGIWNKKG
jgi:hypothetical protein